MQHLDGFLFIPVEKCDDKLRRIKKEELLGGSVAWFITINSGLAFINDFCRLQLDIRCHVKYFKIETTYGRITSAVATIYDLHLQVISFSPEISIMPVFNVVSVYYSILINRVFFVAYHFFIHLFLLAVFDLKKILNLAFGASSGHKTLQTTPRLTIQKASVASMNNAYSQVLCFSHFLEYRRVVN